MYQLIASAAVCLMALVSSLPSTAQTSKGIAGEEVTYTDTKGTVLKGYVVWDASIQGKRPAIVVVPEWWGNNEYARKRAHMLAELGYIAIAADMYGDGKTADNPDKAKEYAMPFYKNPALGQERIEAAMKKIATYKETDKDRIAAIGYCFGGSMVLNAAKMGSNLKGVVSFHGGLATAPASKGSVKGSILVCHGAADKFVPEEDVNNFRKNLDEAGVNYRFLTYPDATHAFTNPDATATGKKFGMPISYNKQADEQSWDDMKAFLKSVL